MIWRTPSSDATPAHASHLILCHWLVTVDSPVLHVSLFLIPVGHVPHSETLRSGLCPCCSGSLPSPPPPPAWDPRSVLPQRTLSLWPVIWAWTPLMVSVRSQSRRDERNWARSWLGWQAGACCAGRSTPSQRQGQTQGSGGLRLGEGQRAKLPDDIGYTDPAHRCGCAIPAGTRNRSISSKVRPTGVPAPALALALSLLRPAGGGAPQAPPTPRACPGVPLEAMVTATHSLRTRFPGGSEGRPGLQWLHVSNCVTGRATVHSCSRHCG